MSFFSGIFSGTFSTYLQQMINTVIYSKEMGTILSFRRQVIMPCGFDTFVIHPPSRRGELGGGEGGLSYGYDGHAGRKIRKRPNRAWVRPHLTRMLLLLFVCLFVFFFQRKNNKRCPQHGYKFWLSVPGWTKGTAAMFFFF